MGQGIRQFGQAGEEPKTGVGLDDFVKSVIQWPRSCVDIATLEDPNPSESRHQTRSRAGCHAVRFGSPRSSEPTGCGYQACRSTRLLRQRLPPRAAWSENPCNHSTRAGNRCSGTAARHV